MAQLMTFITRNFSQGCAEQSFLGAVDLRKFTSTSNCQGDGTTIAVMRGGDVFDVEGIPSVGGFTFRNWISQVAPGFQLRTDKCGSDNSSPCFFGPGTLTLGYLALSSQTLTVIKDDSSQPAITSAPSGINCGGDCSEVYDLNDVITLTAGLKPGWALDFWAPGPGQGPNLTGNPLVITMDRSWTLTAFYKEIITVIGDGRASIVSQTSDIIVVEAIPAPNNYLVGIVCPP